jgi:hypothetical protein
VFYVKAQIYVRHISIPIGMILVQSTYDKNLIEFLSNIKNTLNIVEYQVHQNDTYNSYDNNCYNIFRWTLETS